MGSALRKICGCCQRRKRNSVGAVPEKHLKVLLLGLMGSGKSELGHLLSRQQRQDYEPTNGVQYFRMHLPDRHLSLTEVGGNVEMQKIWHHYFLTTMGLIYCFDMSASFEELQKSFDCFRNTLMHPYVRGKPVLLVGTKADLADEGVQLYDIENAFLLEALAKYYHSSAHVCYVGKSIELTSVWDGVAWLIKYLIDNMDRLQARIKIDANTKAWQDKVNQLVSEGRIKRSRYRHFQYHFKNTARRKVWYRSFGHFRTKRIRPHTAPATINAATFGLCPIVKVPTAIERPEEKFTDVPNPSARALAVGKVS
ncbi:probable ADP-ribosylation factor At2g15310 [Rhagoletis pomonella]|uniref:probable ADP-ribosylation factor At2g15310 n=1 Tax=Rhagoletis pomonella TaxID=28610 RepID=UPI001780EA96|nr:probable ADP-ribosylation factor At2g15310 [Rhagoletis pomonella]